MVDGYDRGFFPLSKETKNKTVLDGCHLEIRFISRKFNNILIEILTTSVKNHQTFLCSELYIIYSMVDGYDRGFFPLSKETKNKTVLDGCHLEIRFISRKFNNILIEILTTSVKNHQTF